MLRYTYWGYRRISNDTCNTCFIGSGDNSTLDDLIPKGNPILWLQPLAMDKDGVDLTIDVSFIWPILKTHPDYSRT